MVKNENMKHDELIQELCRVYGFLKFDSNNSELKKDYEKLKEIALKRMNSYSLIEGMSLQELLTHEEVVTNRTQIDEVFNKLNKYLDNKVSRPKNLSNHDQAVFIIMMDNSGSMGRYEKCVAKAMTTWSKLLLEDRYDKIKTEFIVHHTEAKSVNEDTFFNVTEAGGTIASTSYIRCLEIINSSNFGKNDIYVMHISDGDNLPSDNLRTVNYLHDILNKVNQVHYVEVNQYNRSSTLMHGFKSLNNPKFIKSTIKDEKDILKAILDTFELLACF
ncbi:DUF444 family protein [Paenibacillus sp. FSL H3-0333]|uniref:DUF444 family protein n=1 Tax=Paenibacillus sp. FSL H3-0333 TaxID=2921373 RepID=UPI0030F591D5